MPPDVLLDAIYAAATGDHPWAEVADGLRRLTGASNAALLRLDPATGEVDLLGSPGIPDAEMARYAAEHVGYDPWVIAGQDVVATSLRTRVIRGAVLGPEIVPEATFRHSAFYNDFGRGIGAFHLLGAMQPAGEAGVVLVGLHRPERAEPFGETARQGLDQMLPHLRRGVQLAHRLQAAAGLAAAAALDAMPTGAVVVDASRRVLHANAAAEAMAARGGARLVRDGAVTRLSAAHREDAAALDRRIRAVALLGAAGGAVGLRRGDRPALVAMVMPLPARAWGGGAGVRAGRVLVLLRDPAVPPAPPPEVLSDLYGLTRAEADVVLGAASGATAEAIAALRGVSANTVRRQIRAALEKTGAANLRDLTRLLGVLTP